MEKISKWEKLMAEVARAAEEIGSIPNPTAEDCGMCRAYDNVYMRMRALEASEKKIDKA